MTDRPFLSILIATYNTAADLPGCLDSIRVQTHPGVEVLVADGASSDATPAILEARAGELAYWHSTADEGPYDAWNALLPRARGEWLMFLGADDRLVAPDTTARLAEFCAGIPQRAPQLDYVFGITQFEAEGRPIERFGTEPLAGATIAPEDDFPFSHTGLLHHRDLFDTFGPFSTDYAIAGDAHFMLRSARDPRTRFHHIDLPVARMAAGGLSSSVASRVVCYREVEQARRALGIEPARPHWLASLQRRSAWAAWLHRLLGERGLLLVANAYRRMTGRPPRSRYR